MKTSTIVAAALGGTFGSAFYFCPAYPSYLTDAPTVSFALSIQGLLTAYYASVPVNSSFYSTLPQNTVPPTDFLDNTLGLQQQALLGVQALDALATSCHAKVPTCNYTLPPAPSTAIQHLMNAQVLEATLCGAFIALADYVQSPQAAFLMARLATEHGIHASYLGSHLRSQVFFANSTKLAPAFTPEMLLMPGTGLGTLGGYLNGCVAAPAAPCGGTVVVGDLGDELDGQSFF